MASNKFNFVEYLRTLLEQCHIFTDSTPGEENLKFYHNWRSFTNVIADSSIYPCVVLDEPFTIEYLQQQSGAIFHRYTFTLIFMDLSNLDESADTYYSLALQFEDPVRQFISKLKKYTDEAGYTFNPKIQNTPKGIPFINLFDANASGIFVDFVLLIENDKSVC